MSQFGLIHNHMHSVPNLIIDIYDNKNKTDENSKQGEFMELVVV